MKFHNFEPLTERIVQCHTNVSFFTFLYVPFNYKFIFSVVLFFAYKKFNGRGEKKGNKGDQYKGEQLQL